MKVLYIGVYKDGTGWAHAAKDYILALDSVGIDVVPRAIRLSNNDKLELPAQLLELEQKSSKGCDVVIQHILPHMMDYNGLFRKNIAMYATETSNFKSSSWGNCINNMDEAWVFNSYSREASLNSLVYIPIKVIPHAMDMSKFQQYYDTLPLLNVLGDSFKFYFIGERTRRKNLAALIKAFNLEFDPHEPVELIIKTTSNGNDKLGVKSAMEKFCMDVKMGLRLYKDVNTYKNEYIIVDNYSENDMLRLHASCDCFVMPSYGEAACIPAMEAMAMGKTPIVTDQTGMVEYINNDVGTVVPSQNDVVFGLESPFNDLFTGRETWRAINLPSLCVAMREAYENKELHQRKSFAGIEHAYKYSYKVIGDKMKDMLCKDISY